MTKIKAKDAYDSYMLCFKDFQNPEHKRKPCVFVKLRNKTNDTKEEIMKHFSRIRTSTSFLREMGITDGVWGLIACSPIKDVWTVTYEENLKSATHSDVHMDEDLENEE